MSQNTQAASAAKSKFSVRDICYAGLFAAVIAVMAQISIPMPLGVPMTMQTFAIPQLMHHVGHVGHEIVVIAFAGIALCAEQMMGTKYDAHAFSPGMRFRRFRPMAQARTALMMAVGMKGRTQAVMPTAMVLWATTTNIATPTT